MAVADFCKAKRRGLESMSVYSKIFKQKILRGEYKDIFGVETRVK